MVDIVHCTSWLWMAEGVAGTDIAQASANALLSYAARAFEIGLSDGVQRVRPRSSDGLMLALMVAGDRWPGVFQHSMRSVYLAGFRLAKVVRVQPVSEFRVAGGRGGKRVIKNG
jgi:hypothetical protein